MDQVREWLGRAIRDFPDDGLHELVFAVKELQKHYHRLGETEAPPKGPVN